MLKGGLTTGAMTKPHGINVSSSCYGKAVKLVYGLAQVSPDLVWYNDWKSSDHPSNFKLSQVLGQSAGKKSKKSGVKYYSAAVNMLMGHAPMRGILSIWYNNQKFAIVPCSASGFVSGGSFSFTPISGNSKTTFAGTIPASGPYTITVPNFVSDLDTVRVNGQYRQPAANPPGPGAGQYSVSPAGVYTFNVADAGLSVSITYRKTGTGTAAILAGVYAATIAETFSETFNDYGGPGAVTMYGTWERPLWNKTFPVPGRIDAGAYAARDPYSFLWDGVSPAVTVPSALNGLPITVYYGVPAIYKSNGDFYSSRITPLELLNLEFEQVFGSGSEYTKHPDQQVVQEWACGLGSIRFDLGAANAVANLNLETIGSFTLWPNGDCDVADIIKDIIFSGPVLT